MLKQQVNDIKEKIEIIQGFDFDELEENVNVKTTQLFENLKENIAENIGAVTSTIEEMGESLEDSSITEIISTINEKIPEQLENFTDKLSSSIESTTDNLKSEIESVTDTVKDNLVELKSKVSSILEDANTQRQGHLNNIESIIIDIEQKITQLIQKADNSGEEFKSLRAIVEEGVQAASSGVDGVAIAIDETQQALRSMAGI